MECDTRQTIRHPITTPIKDKLSPAKMRLAETDRKFSPFFHGICNTGLCA